MPAFYREANLAICMSLYEGASNSVMEAMAAGQALVSTDCGNVREMYDSQLKIFGESGIIILEERTTEALVAALSELKEDVARVVRMGVLNRTEISERWSWKAWAPRYSKFIKDGLHG